MACHVPEGVPKGHSSRDLWTQQIKCELYIQILHEFEWKILSRDNEWCWLYAYLGTNQFRPSIKPGLAKLEMHGHASLLAQIEITSYFRGQLGPLFHELSLLIPI